MQWRQGYGCCWPHAAVAVAAGFRPPSNLSSGTADPDNGNSAILRGTAATGAALSEATITVQDQTGASVCITRTDNQGAYAARYPRQPSHCWSLARSETNNALQHDRQRHRCCQHHATGQRHRLPAVSGRTTSLGTAIQANAGLVTDARLQQRIAALVKALKPVLAALGQGQMNAITDAFRADGTGHEKVLDALSVSLRPESDGANIEVTVKVATATESGAPVSIIFRSSDTDIPALPSGMTLDRLGDIPSPTALAELFGR